MSEINADDGRALLLKAPTAERMRAIGAALAHIVRGGDVLVLSGPLGAGKTTLAQGFGRGLKADGPIVSPTFTIARELQGQAADGSPLRLVHVDAYRLGSAGYEPGQDSTNLLLDQLESLGLDEELEDPGERTVVLMEWGQQMASALAPARLEVNIERPLKADDVGDEALTSKGLRMVRIRPVGDSWKERMGCVRRVMEA
ncbi:hypothetical protein BACT_0661 [Bifidobacterium actinocoloniiforme DSM 22766]|uniref:tRNA threonylcarbamoyladenosine biosynthesis protein TsaE n=1 Tax=Bifidobacterium actinocoloniiforme DSM 22766 TaxID=1437605 RepID=A0A086Z0B0_9BIFI|nr:tRNA (adenosine(37)-N6)-threonylcarbamoyltransferase complex ATPase subunit type 1 TsaE [Bifidobacterium actinocoloniiforme]AKV55212.1 ATPase [Bifidobacterium actinocoloniiforme DSM 22766]KFI39960.1 hypothetical protein BACT_0661 [Bifidobacterium actinocoloniiforme DSM 22766]